jgi:nicotinate (nicotinamide) nucleotide adenylyltransferase
MQMKMLFIFLILLSQNILAKVLYVTDLEGNRAPIDTLVAQNNLKLVDGVLDFSDTTSHLVFGGDLVDRGPDSIKLREWMISMKEKYPERVTLLWGNRDLNKLALLRDLDGLKILENKEYKTWLENEAVTNGEKIPTQSNDKIKFLKKINSTENQLKFWFANQGAPQALDFHKKELVELTGKNVSLAEAAEDMVKSITPPNGRYFKYLELGQLGDVKGKTVFVHGGLTKENLGRVPGATTVEKNVSKWLNLLNRWGQNSLAKIKKSYIANPKNIFDTKLLIYGDATWDPTVNKVLTTNQSVIYPMRYKESGNFRLPDDSVLNLLKDQGYNQLALGHSPVGNVPVPLKKDGFIVLMADTSYGPSGGQTSIVINESGGFKISGYTADGKKINYDISPKSIKAEPYLGMLVEDKWIIAGKTTDGDYLAYRYVDGYKIEENILTVKQLKKFKIASPSFVVNEEVMEARKIFQEALEQKGIKPITLQEFNTGEFLNGKKPIYFSGASKLSFDDGSAQKVREVIVSILDSHSPQEFLIGTGGTHLGVEKIVHEEAAKRGFKIVGTPISQAVPGELAQLDYLSIVGDDWDEMLDPAIKWTKAQNGKVFFLGGGGIVANGIETAEKVGAEYYLYKGIGGASEEKAGSYASRIFSTVSELNVKPKKVGIYTGSFDPPHKGHRDVVQGIKAKLGLDEVYIVPDASVQYKPNMQSYSDRTNMVNILFKDDPGIKVIPAEIASKIPPNAEMWDIVAEIKNANPDSKLHNIMGSDTYEWFKTLPEEQRIKDVTIVVNNRDPNVKIPSQLDGQEVKLIELNLGDRSSSSIRTSIKKGELSTHLTPEVNEYIQDRALYKSAVLTPDEIKSAMSAKNKEVVTFVGYSALDYQDKDQMLRQAKKILSGLDPTKTIINIGATDDGIGAVYKLAKEMGFETTGVVSVKAKEYGGVSKFVDYTYFVEDKGWGGFVDGTTKLSPTSQAMVENSNRMIGIGGGEIGAQEMRAAIIRDIPVEFIPGEMNHQNAITRAKKSGTPAPVDFKGPAQAIMKPQVATQKQVKSFFNATGKKVVTFVGYSGAGYQDPAKMLEQARNILGKLDPATVIINIGGTPEGIGEVYRLAKEMGFETTGVVSSLAKKYGGLSPYVDHPFYIKDPTWGGLVEGKNYLSPTSKVMINNSDLVVGIGGGAIGGDELAMAKKLGKDVVFYPAELNYETAIKKAEKAGLKAPTTFKGEAHSALLGGKVKGNICSNKLLNDVTISLFAQ